MRPSWSPPPRPSRTWPGLIEALKADPGAVSWAGGSAGGTDHIAVGLIAKAAGVDPTKINYIAYSGGGEALAAILGNQVTAGVSSLGEFDAQVKAGTLRLLAVSSPERIAGHRRADAEGGRSGRGIAELAHGRRRPGPQRRAEGQGFADIEKMVKSENWQKQLADKGWSDTYLSGADFDAQLAKDEEATAAVLKDIGLVK
jgi:putative tricarboxylic transport membrane protein